MRENKLLEVKNSSLIRVNISCDLIKAIAYIHNLNLPIFHGDIKPSNLLIIKVGYNAKLCDFASKICFKYAGKLCISYRRTT
jgi:serine/threonine protein kinase